MKQKLLCFGILSLVTQFANAQSIKTKELQLYVTLGVKPLSSKNFFYSSNVSPSLATTVGAGSLIQRNRIQFGTEFYFLKGSKHSQGIQSEFSGLNTSAIVGYSFNMQRDFRINLQTGITYSLNHMYVTDEASATIPYNTAVLHNNNCMIPAQVFLQKLTAKGTFVGLKAGYAFAVKKNVWEYRHAEGGQSFSTSADPFYIQLSIGGIFKTSKL